MWLQIAAQQFPVFKMGGSIYPVIAPYAGMPTKPEFVEQYENCNWRGQHMSLLEFLRKVNKKGDEPIRSHRRHLQERKPSSSSDIDDE